MFKTYRWLMQNVLSVMCMTFAVTMLTACGDDDPNDDKPTKAPTVVNMENTVDAGTSTITTTSFSAPENWRVTENTGSEWLTVSPSQGVAGADKTLSISVKANSSQEPRTAEVVVKTVASGFTLLKVNITQKGFEKDDVDDNTPPASLKSNATELVSKIAVGWNLGNTCEAGIWDGWKDDDLNIETNWISPKVKTSKAMFTALKNEGFNAIRIPVRWYVHSDATSFRINDRWIARVKEIVDYAVSQDMYVILNSHHDNWYDRLPVGYNESAIQKRFETMWTQIATEFKGYDEHLIFAGANEIIKLDSKGNEQWGTPTTENIQFVNRLMQTFVNTVRSTGGNNKWRCLMVQPWAANPQNAINNAFALPKDSKENRLIVEYHCYDPYNYAIGKDQSGNNYAQHKPSASDLQYVSQTFAKLNTKFVAKGTPCIMAEFGSTQDNHSGMTDAEADKIRADYHKFIVSEAKKYNIPGFYWDNYCFTSSGENFGLLDRQKCTFPARAKIALKGIMDGLK